jgi:hypothetical protein
MALLHLPADAIDETHLRRLIAGKAVETREIDYKRDRYGGADKDAGEYLADISSFANTVGGDIIIGMAARAGVPTAIVPLQIDIDAETLRLEQLARTGLQPRIFGFTIRQIPVSGGAVLLLRIPRSYNLPHRIIRQGAGHHRFWARSSAGKYEPNVDELRTLFVRAPQLAERIRDFRLERVARIAADDVPVRIGSPPTLILHVMPFSAFDTRIELPLVGLEIYSLFPPLGSPSAQNVRINVDGLLGLSNRDQSAVQRAYAQAYHSGIVESLWSGIADGEGTEQSPLRLRALRVDATIVQYAHAYIRSLLQLGCAPPFAVLVSLIGVKGLSYSFADASAFFEDEANSLDRDQFHFTEVVIENLPASAGDLALQLRPLLDQTANAAGRPGSPWFRGDGSFSLRV